MTTDSLPTKRASATIYQFPAGGRSGVEANRNQTAAADLSSRVTGGSFGSWYHEAAIQESMLASER
jgi:uncharacterized protein DUF2735